MDGWSENVLIIGAGQGGLSTSYYLTQAGIPHRIVDRGGVANAWARNRWDSFCLVTPNWTVNLPGRPYGGIDPDGFMPRDEFVAYMENWARSFNAPVTTGIDVSRIRRDKGQFHVTAGKTEIRAQSVVVATATFQHPKVPGIAGKLPDDVRHFHAEDYKNPRQAAPGSVLVVGSGQTGCQVVEDMLRAGRRTYLCVARNGRLPRRYRGHDIIHWQKLMGLLDRTPDMLDDPSERFTGDPHVTGRDGGATVSLYNFARRGVQLLGRLDDVRDRTLLLREDLAANLDHTDTFCRILIGNIDEFIAANGIDAPPHHADEDLGYLHSGQSRPKSPESLNLDRARIRTVIWATGFSYDFSWIDDVPVDGFGYPLTDGGASPMDGLFFCGLNWMTRRKSGILYGIDEDGRLVASQIKNYLSRQIKPEGSFMDRGAGCT